MTNSKEQTYRMTDLREEKNASTEYWGTSPYYHSSKHSEVVRGPYVIDFFVAHDGAVFDGAGAIEAWLRDKNVIDATVWPGRPCGKVIALGPRCSFMEFARLFHCNNPKGPPPAQC